MLKNIVMTVPVVLALTGPAMASISDSGVDFGPGETPAVIDSLLNRYAGLAPGASGPVADLPAVQTWNNVSAFTVAVAPMSSYFTVMGSDRGVRLESAEHYYSDMNAEAAAPEIARITLTHHVTESVTSASGDSLTPTSSGSSSSSQQIASAKTTIGIDSGTGTIIDGTTTPTPIPPAGFLFGSALAFLAPLGRRLRSSLV